MDHLHQQQQQQQQQQQASQDKDLSFLSWRDDWFLSTFPLTAGSVMDYFCRPINPFYDKTCLNETFKMQRIDPSIMNEMEGIEYTLFSYQEPHLYNILKVYRHGGGRNAVTRLAMYYINGGTVYQAPGLFDVVQARMYNTLSVLTNTYHEIEDRDNRSGDKHASRTKPVEAEVEKEDSYRYLTMPHIPPYPANMQVHVDYMLYNLEVETREMVDQKHRETEMREAEEKSTVASTVTTPMMTSMSTPTSVSGSKGVKRGRSPPSQDQQQQQQQQQPSPSVESSAKKIKIL